MNDIILQTRLHDKLVLVSTVRLVDYGEWTGQYETMVFGGHGQLHRPLTRTTPPPRFILIEDALEHHANMIRKYKDHPTVVREMEETYKYSPIGTWEDCKKATEPGQERDEWFEMFKDTMSPEKIDEMLKSRLEWAAIWLSCYKKK